MDNIITISKEQLEQIRNGRFLCKRRRKTNCYVKTRRKKTGSQQRYDGESQYQVAKAQAFLTGARWADKTLLDKACEWLKENIDAYGKVVIVENSIPTIKLLDDFEINFRKAMEELWEK